MRSVVAVFLSVGALSACGSLSTGEGEGEGEPAGGEGEGEGEAAEGEGDAGEGEGEAPACPYTNDGECDEPSICPPGTDTADCSICDGCCTDPTSECRPSEVCRFQENDVAGGGDGVGTCVSAESIPYTITIGDIALCETDPNGAEWDAGAGAPDPFVSVVVNGAAVATSAATQDRFNFNPAFQATITLRSTDVVSLIVSDEDLTSNDFGGGFCLGDACDSAIGVAPLRGVDTVLQGNCSPGGVASMAYSLFPTPN